MGDAPVGCRVHHCRCDCGLLCELLDLRGLLDYVMRDRGEPTAGVGT
jgi:hypothetical protein